MIYLDNAATSFPKPSEVLEFMFEFYQTHGVNPGRSSYDLISSAAEVITPGSDKLIFLPWLSGERAPVLDHYARGGYIGLNMSHSKGHMARALMEGVAYHLRWICEAMEKIGYKIREAQMQKVNYMLVLGDKEIEAGAVAVRSRDHGDLGVMDAQDFISKLGEEIKNKEIPQLTN